MSNPAEVLIDPVQIEQYPGENDANDSQEQKTGFRSTTALLIDRLTCRMASSRHTAAPTKTGANCTI